MSVCEHILIDGWNVIHSHPQLSRLIKNGQYDSAQSQLWQMLSPVHDFEAVRVTVVYDGNGVDISIVRRCESLTFSELYSPSTMTADELIEQLCATSSKSSSILVVTRDNLLSLTASSFGAIINTPDIFFKRIQKSTSNLKSATVKTRKLSENEWKKANPFHKLDELAVDLTKLRISPIESSNLKRIHKKELRALKKSQSSEDILESNTNFVEVAKKSPRIRVPKKKVETMAELLSKPLYSRRLASQSALEALKESFDNLKSKTEPVKKIKTNRSKRSKK